MSRNIIADISLTHILSRKKQTFIAAMGVTIGIALYVFSNSLMEGFAQYSRAQMFKTIPHIRIYKEDEISKPLLNPRDTQDIVVITNPKIVTTSQKIVNAERIVQDVKAQPYIRNAATQVNVDIFYNTGRTQLKGLASGVHIADADAMFDLQSTVVAGSLSPLSSRLDAIAIGQGIAEKLNVSIGDYITVTSSMQVYKTFTIVAIFRVGNKSTDETKSYVHITAAQQLLREGPDYATDIYASINDADSSLIYAEILQPLIPYKVEDWQTSNADTMATDGIRKIMNNTVGVAIMMIAAFGIYNILNMTITSKLNDIAILKATGFSGKDVVKIFVLEAAIMGIIGTVMGIILASVLIQIASQIYIGPPIGYFPITIDPMVFVIGAIFGMTASIGAGYFPSRKAAKVDPVSIFRR